MSNLSTYISKKVQYETLQKELASLEKKGSIKQDLNFIHDVESLLNKHQKTASDLKKVVSLFDHKPSKTDKRMSLPEKQYRHPKTGETIKARRTNNKILKQWCADLDVAPRELEI